MANNKLKILLVVVLSWSFVSIFGKNEFEEKDDELNHSTKKELRTVQAREKSAYRENTCPTFAIKTNLIYLAGLLPDFNYYTPVPNLEAEYFFADNWSVAATGAYAKWGTGSGKEFGISSWSVEPRYRFHTAGAVESLYIGLYGMAGDFDKKGYGKDPLLGNRTGAFQGGGLSAGFFIPAGKRWGVEVGLRLGVRHTETDLYCDQEPEYYRDETTTKTAFDLQGMKIAIVYRFGFK